MRLENKVALITGGGSGVGAATARLFAAEGAKVVVTGRRPDPLGSIAKEVGGVAVAGDTSDPTHIAEAVATCVSEYGGIDVIVACAGGAFGGAVKDLKDEDWRKTFDVNLNGPMMLSRAALPVMLERGGGSIIIVSSVNGMSAAPAAAAYDISKAGAIALTRALAVDYGTRGIRANALCPGWISTPMGDVDMDELGEAEQMTRQAA
jgi:meso-butanediol dehydrogenase / (S,S)-butanediol dehydrogenase / diacetyl reductase